jgi:hypothetical protein
VNISFAAQHYAWLFLSVLPLLLFHYLLWRWRRKADDKFMPPERRIHDRVASRMAAVVLAVSDVILVAILVAGMMRPELRSTEYKPIFENITTVIACDVSPSMKAEGGYFGEGGRLGAVKTAFTDLLAANKRQTLRRLPGFLTGETASVGRVLEGQRIGLVGFAGEAFTLMPPTTKHSQLVRAMRHLSTDTPTVSGTNFEAAIEESLLLFMPEDKVRVIILLTDGEEEEGKSIPIDAILEEAAKAKAVIFTVVVGHERALIPGTEIWTEPAAIDADAQGGIKSGSVPEKLAQRTGGVCRRFKDREQLYGILAEIFSKAAETAKEPVEKRTNLQPWLAAVFVLLAVIRLFMQYAFKGENRKPA